MKDVGHPPDTLQVVRAFFLSLHAHHTVKPGLRYEIPNSRFLRFDVMGASCCANLCPKPGEANGYILLYNAFAMF